jgi:DNA invertase Pin-like site-specific DNA recombinase
MQKFVAYYRVSTARQGASGLGWDAQRETVARFIQAGELLAEFTEIESGKKHTNRPQLAAALTDCKKRKATLIIAKLERLARNVHFISSLMESKVDFVAVDMPVANRLTIYILAAVAEHEREMISQRTKAALSQAKLRGIRLGSPNLAAARLLAAAKNRTPPAAEVVEFARKMRDCGESFRAITQQLNDLNIKTGRGSVWYPKTVRALLLQQARPRLTSHLLFSTSRRRESPGQLIPRKLETA